MEEQQISNVLWVLVGVQPIGASSIEKEVLDRLTAESFMDDRTYQLFLCGAYVDVESNLADMESGFHVLKSKMEDYQEGDYAIVAKHPEANLLFIPVEANDENISGNTDNIQGEGLTSS